MDYIRVELSPEEEMAVVTLAFLEATNRGTTSSKIRTQDPVIWRFSSRWWAAPMSTARSHRY